MKRDDIVSGVVAGTIIVVGCTVGFFGYQKMHEPLYIEPSVEQIEKSESQEYYSNNDVDPVEQDQGERVYVVEYEDSEESNNTDNKSETAPIKSYDSDLYEVPTESSANIQLADGSRQDANVLNGTGSDANYFDTYNIPEQQNTSEEFVLNTSTRKIHHPGCKDVPKINPENYEPSSSSLEELEAQGYTKCGHCF